MFLNGPFCFRVQTSPNPKEGDGILPKRWTKLIDCPKKVEDEKPHKAAEQEDQQGWNCIIA